MQQASSRDGPIRTIRVDDELLESILDDLDTVAGQASPNRRKSERYPYRCKQIRADIQQPGDASPAPYYIRPRNLSEGGLSFIHGGFVHIGSKCRIQLVTVHGAWKIVEGVVVSCRLLQRNLHEVGVRFHHNIDPSEFCREAVHLSILLAEDDPAMTKLATAFLDNLNAEVDHAENGRVVVAKAESKLYDLILMDIEMPELDGLDATKELRAKGYSGVIVAATALTGPGDREKCLEAGCDDYLAKPYGREGLADLLKSLDQEPIFSTLSDDPAMREIIPEFVAELPGKIRKIEEAMINKNVQALSALVRGLKGEGTGYGFKCISEAADKVEKTLLQGADQAATSREVNGLLRLCLQVRSSARLGHPTAAPTGTKAPAAKA